MDALPRDEPENGDEGGGGAGEANGARGIADAPYLDAVVKETMRLCPAAPIVVRRLLRPMTFGGREVPAGTTVAPCVHLVHRNPEIYPQPLKFLPGAFSSSLQERTRGSRSAAVCGGA